MYAKTIGKMLTQAAKLPGRAVCVFESEAPQEGWAQVAKVDRCLARAVYKISSEKSTPPIYYGPEARAGICFGGQRWCGVTNASSMTKYLISTGSPDFMSGAAEYLKPNPDAAGRYLEGPGKIAFPSKYLTIAGWDQIDEGQDVLSFILIGNAESIRNLGGLIGYAFEDIFYSIVMPSAPSCASMITFAAGLSEKAPRDAAFIGPVDPTGNAWFPPEMMSLAIPFEMAQKMAENMEGSFLVKRSDVAFPVKRLGIVEAAELPIIGTLREAASE
jgi:hypothetical protein